MERFFRTGELFYDKSNSEIIINPENINDVRNNIEFLKDDLDYAKILEKNKIETSSGEAVKALKECCNEIEELKKSLTKLLSNSVRFADVSIKGFAIMDEDISKAF